jgi:hypothetical protein
LRGRINGADRYAHNGDHRDRHDQQQDETAGTEYQTASLRRKCVEHGNSANPQRCDNACVV